VSVNDVVASGQDSRLAGDKSAPTVAEVLNRFDRLVRTGEIASLAPLATGFQPLDRVLGGGLRPGDLVLVGGAQGVGKTTLTLQMARNLAAQGNVACTFVCYEHDELYLLQRLLALEAFLARDQTGGDSFSLSELRDALLTRASPASRDGAAGLAGALGKLPASAAAVARLAELGSRLHLQKTSDPPMDVAALRRAIRLLKDMHGPRVALFLDYLQKVPVVPAAAEEEERVTRIVNGLRELSLEEAVPIVAVVAANQAGLQAPRLRLHHLRGSSSLSYESDVVLILNNKYHIVARNKITYRYHEAQELRNWVVCTVEKNRSGQDFIDMEFRAHLGQAAFEPTGNYVAEPLIDERIGDE